MPKYIYNHKRGPKDERDYKHHLMCPHDYKASPLPKLVDLRSTNCIPPVLDQGNLGSCTANASSNALRYLLSKEKKAVFQPSRLFIYYFSRFIEGTINEDSGCIIRDVMKELHTFGACDETAWPYDAKKYAIRPNNALVRAASVHTKGFTYMEVKQDLVSLKTALYQGLPIVFGIDVYDSFESDETLKTGNVPMPDVKKEANLGGHCVLLVSANDETKRFTFQNSWGESVGDKGFFTIPYDYLTIPDLASEFYAIKFFA